MIEVLLLTTCLSQFCDSCQSCSPPVYYQYQTPIPRQTVSNSPLTFELQNVPLPEVSRETAKISLDGKYYYVPVLNDLIPTITIENDNYLILDYKKQIRFNRVRYKANSYLSYGRIDEQAASVGGIKSPRSTNQQPGVERPNDQEIENLLKGAETAVPPKQVTPLRERSLLKRPSAVDSPNDNLILPRY